MIDNFALIIGAMKSGTTSLFSYLAQHPQISACRDKEPRFFTNSNKWAKGFGWYQSLWDWNPDQHKVALEASTSYTRDPTRPNPAKKISQCKNQANFKFIYIMRDPLDRIESHYAHVQAEYQSAGKNVAFESIYSDLVSTSQYAKQVKEHYKYFPPSSILLLKFEDLKADPLNLIKNVCCFLDVDPEYKFQRLNIKYNSSHEKLVYSSFCRSIRKKSPQSLIKLIPHEKKQALTKVLGQKKVERDFRLTSKQRSFVAEELQQDLQELRLEYGIDISDWDIEIQ